MERSSLYTLKTFIFNPLFHVYLSRKNKLILLSPCNGSLLRKYGREEFWFGVSWFVLVLFWVHFVLSYFIAGFKRVHPTKQAYLHLTLLFRALELKLSRGKTLLWNSLHHHQNQVQGMWLPCYFSYPITDSLIVFYPCFPLVVVNTQTQHGLWKLFIIRKTDYV